MAKEWPREIKDGSVVVKVYRNKHHGTASGWIFVVAWTTAEGRQREKFADEGEAIGAARVKAAQLKSGRVEGASMSTGDRDELQAARALTGAVPLLAAVREWAKGREISGGNIIPACEAWAARNGKAHKRVKVEDAVEEYLKERKPKGHGPTFDRVNKDFGSLYLDTISAKQIDAWLGNWAHPVTRNTYRRRLLALFNFAQRKGYLSRDAKNEAELSEAAKVENNSAVGIINVATWRALLAHFRARHPELLPALVLAGFCGLRRSEIHGQKWDDISLERKNLRVTKAKPRTPARRMVPLSDAAIEWLMLCPNRQGYVCPLVPYKGKMQPALALDGIRRIARDAEPPFELPENAFRHAYISHAVEATGDIPRVSLNAGNSPKEINAHYRELVSEEDGKAWFDSAPGKLGEVVQMRKAAS